MNNPNVVFSQPKLQGEWAEVCFIQQAVARGLRVSEPLGTSSPYDVILDSNGRLLRVQVKSVAKLHRGDTYRISSKHGNSRRRSYLATYVDFLAALVIPESAWYIIPVAEAACTSIDLCPHRPSNCRHERFREAWHLFSSNE